TDRRQIDGSQSISYFPDSKWWARGLVAISGTWKYNFAGMLRVRNIYLNWQNRFAGQTLLVLQYLPLSDERFRGRFFTNLHQADIMVRSPPTQFMSFNVSLEKGRFIYRSMNPQYGNGYNLSVSATLKPTARLKLELSFNSSTL